MPVSSAASVTVNPRISRRRRRRRNHPAGLSVSVTTSVEAEGRDARGVPTGTHPARDHVHRCIAIPHLLSCPSIEGGVLDSSGTAPSQRRTRTSQPVLIWPHVPSSFRTASEESRERRCGGRGRTQASPATSSVSVFSKSDLRVCLPMSPLLTEKTMCERQQRGTVRQEEKTVNVEGSSVVADG